VKLGDRPSDRPLDGVEILVPAAHRREAMVERMAIKSGWGMPDEGVGLWLIEPGKETGRVFPIFLTRDEFLALEIAE
jgi:hypothetical protein